MNIKSKYKHEFKFSEPATYQIKVSGELQKEWSDRLKGMQIIIDRQKDQKPVSILTGRMSDQSDLSGVLNTLYELHLAVLSVKMLK
jgi:putative lipoic acid-binding regulatory protein